LPNTLSVIEDSGRYSAATPGGRDEPRQLAGCGRLEASAVGQGKG